MRPGFTLNRLASPDATSARVHRMNIPDGIGVTFPLDQVSRLRLRTFAFKLLILVPVAVVLASRHNYPLLGTMAFFCFWQGMFAGMAALFQRHKHNAAVLTAWDEMAAFLGLTALMRLVDTLIG
jgi:hypothetical protein